MTTETIDAPAEVSTSADIAQRPEAANPETLPEAQNTATDAPEGEPKPEDAATAARKVHDATQRRINRLVAERAQERAQRQLLEQRLAQFERRPADDEPQQQAQRRELGPDDIRREAASMVEAQRFVEQCNAVVAKGRAASPDFERQLASLSTITGPLLDDRGQAEPLLQAVLTADEPHKVLMHLAAHPDVAADLADMTPLQQARKLALIERDMKPPARQPSAAPAPLTPLRAAADTDGEPDASDVSRWNDWFEKRHKGGGRRR